MKTAINACAPLVLMGTLALVALTGCGSTPQVGESNALRGTSKPEIRFGDLPNVMNPTAIDETTFSAELPNSDDTWHTQEKDEYCWAACMQTVLSLHGKHDIPTQVELWEQNVSNPMFQEDRDAATFVEIRHTLAPGYRTEMAGYFVVDVLDSTTTTDLVRELAAGQPVIVGLRQHPDDKMGHACVAYGIKYKESEDKSNTVVQGMKDATKKMKGFFSGDKNANNQPKNTNEHQAIAIYLFDPAEIKDGGGKKEIPIEEIIESLDFAISSASAKRFLEQQLAWLSKYDDGPGVYVRNPLEYNGKPTSKNTIKVPNN